jgi:menaquinol-cytochrome c reductase iron-sulfur subunit
MKMGRRIFLMRAGGAVAAAGLAVPAVITLIAPALEGDPDPLWTGVAELDAFPLGSMTAALIEVDRDERENALRERLLYVRRTAEGAVEVFSRNCTDLSCPLNWDEGSRTFLCPCHGGIFNSEGKPIAGPPSKPMFRYAHRIHEGILEVDVNSVPPIV